MRCCKKAMFRTAITGALAMGSLAMGLVTEASAGCPNLPGLKAGAFQPISWQRTGEFGPGSPLLVADGDDSVDRIVGFWNVKYVLPDDTVLGGGFQQWHSDGTEIHNADGPAAQGNVCLGVWKKTARSHYKLNQLTWTVAAINTPGPLRSMAMISQGTLLSTSRARWRRPVSP